MESLFLSTAPTEWLKYTILKLDVAEHHSFQRDRCANEPDGNQFPLAIQVTSGAEIRTKDL